MTCRSRRFIGIVSPAVAPLRRWLPGVARVLELALCQVIEACLLLPEKVKLARMLGGVDFGVIYRVIRDGRFDRSVPGGI